MKFTTKSIARAAVIAAFYAALTMIFQPISFGAVQFRIAEALTLLPILTLDAVPGLFIGCLLANLMGGAPWFDILFGALATLLAAIMTRRFRKNRVLAAAMPVLFNGVIVGPIVYAAYVHVKGTATNWPLLWSTIGTVSLGEAVVCFTLGLLLIEALKRVPSKIFD